MLRGRLTAFVQRCEQRGIPFQLARECIVSQEGDVVVVDETHPAYPRAPGDKPVNVGVLVVRGGPGTELKKLLARMGIAATEGCGCNARALDMDFRERASPGWCEEHIEEIVGWMREEASKRGLPFLDVAGRLLVRRAIKNASNAAAAAQKQGLTPVH